MLFYFGQTSQEGRRPCSFAEVLTKIRAPLQDDTLALFTWPSQAQATSAAPPGVAKSPVVCVLTKQPIVSLLMVGE